MNKKSIKDVDVKGKKCLVRCDFNVPLKEGKSPSAQGSKELRRCCDDDIRIHEKAGKKRCHRIAYKIKSTLEESLIGCNI